MEDETPESTTKGQSNIRTSSARTRIHVSSQAVPPKAAKKTGAVRCMPANRGRGRGGAAKAKQLQLGVVRRRGPASASSVFQDTPKRAASGGVRLDSC